MSVCSASSRRRHHGCGDDDELQSPARGPPTGRCNILTTFLSSFLHFSRVAVAAEFYYDLAVKEHAKRSKYYKYFILPWRFFPLAFGRTNVLSRETLRFCEAVGAYFPNALKIEAKIRACLSRAITSGVAATFNDEMRQLQLSTLNAVASSMVPPAPDRRSKDPALVGSKSNNARAFPSSSSVLTMYNRLSAIVYREEPQRLSAEADEHLSSQSSGLLSQLSATNLSAGWIS